MNNCDAAPKMTHSVKKDNLIQRMLQTGSVIISLYFQVGTFLTIPFLTLYIFCTKFWWLCALYITWSLTLGKNSRKTGERRSEWVRSWSLWTYVRDYYPMKIVKTFNHDLDPKRNYLFIGYPHGVLSVSSIIAFSTNALNVKNIFPHHLSSIHSISALFVLPFLRELALTMGVMDASKEAIENNLTKVDGGNISLLTVGGAQEAYYSNPGVYKIIFKKRKGFVKIALRTGAPLVPVLQFGEPELFTQAEVLPNSILHKIREFVRKICGFSLVFPVGRKDLFGLVPRRLPLTVVVGEPIDVQKTENPTQEQIDNLHQLFEKKLVELFESQKKNYIKDYETAHLEIL